MHGADEIVASCLRCDESLQAPITVFPSATSVTKIQALLLPSCGGREIDGLANVAGKYPEDQFVSISCL